MLKKIANKISVFNDRVNSLLEKFHFKNKMLSKLFVIGVFVTAIHVFYSYIGVYKYIGNRPSSIHLSAQTQRASIALNYYKADMNFFKPRIQRYLKGEGITGVEFPIIYYAAALMYKAFGFNELYLRAISLIIVTLGFFFFYLLANQFLRNPITAFMVSIAGALSPVLLFYTPNFMPDAPSMGLHLMSWYFFFNYIKSKSNKQLNLFVFTGTLAALIKATSAMGFVIVLCLLVLDRLKFFKTTDKVYLFTSPLKILKTIAVGFLCIIAWYAYATWLTKHYEYESFALKTLVVNEWSTAQEIFVTIKNLWLSHYYAYEGYVLMAFALGVVLLLMKYANKILLSITLLYLIGNVCYVYLFLYQFRWHDYYVIAIVPLVFFAMLTFAEMVVRCANNYFVLLQLALMLGLFFNLKESAKYCKKSYNERNSRAIYYWTGDYRAYEDLEPKLRKAGIKRTDKFLSGFDDTYCGSLYLIDQIGVNFGNESSVQDIDAMIKHPDIKYLILNDSARLNKVYPNDLASKVLLTHRGLIVYKLK